MPPRHIRSSTRLAPARGRRLGLVRRRGPRPDRRRERRRRRPGQHASHAARRRQWGVGSHGTPPADDAARFPAIAPTLRERASALLGRIGPLLWLYALVPVPLLTDWIENGALPASRGGWLTEVCGGLVITALVWRVRRDRRALEALARSDGLTRPSQPAQLRGRARRRMHARATHAPAALRRLPRHRQVQGHQRPLRPRRRRPGPAPADGGNPGDDPGRRRRRVSPRRRRVRPAAAVDH